MDRNGRGIKGRKSLTQQRRQDAGQYIAAAARGHSGVARRVAVRTSSISDDGDRSFENDNHPMGAGELRSHLLAMLLHFLDRASGESCEFTRMRRDHARGCSSIGCEEAVPGSNIQGISIENKRARGSLQDIAHHRCGGFVLTKPWPDSGSVSAVRQHRSVGGGEWKQTELRVVDQPNRHDARLERSDDRLNGPGDNRRHKPGPRPQSSHGCKAHRAAHADRAADDGDFSERALVTVRRTQRERWQAERKDLC